MNNVIKVGLYIRVSTEEQAKHGYSIDSQRSRLMEYSNDHKYKIVDYYIDEGKSARSKLSNRKELSRLLEDVKTNKIDRIIIWRLDRWFRNVADYYRIQDVLDKYHVDWECTDEEYNTSTSNGRLYLNIKLSIAQNESDQTSDRIKFNFDRMVKNKHPIFGTKSLPIGYMVIGEKAKKQIVKNPDEENITNDIFKIFRETSSIRKTLLKINEKYNQEYQYQRIKKVLSNPIFYGCYRDIEDFCEPYISKDEFNKNQEIIKSKNVKWSDKHYDYIFSGLVFCYKCGCRMAGNSSRRYSTSRTMYVNYRCNKNGLHKLCENRNGVNERLLEQWLVDNFLVKMQNYITSLENTQSDSQLDNVEYKINKVKTKIDRLNEVYINGNMNKEKYENQIFNYKSELKDLETNLDKKPIDLKKYDSILKNANCMDIYQKLDNVHKRAFWSEYINKIEQDGDGGFNIFFK